MNWRSPTETCGHQLRRSCSGTARQSGWLRCRGRWQMHAPRRKCRHARRMVRRACCLCCRPSRFPTTCSSSTSACRCPAAAGPRRQGRQRPVRWRWGRNSEQADTDPIGWSPCPVPCRSLCFTSASSSMEQGLSKRLTHPKQRANAANNQTPGRQKRRKQATSQQVQGRATSRTHAAASGGRQTRLCWGHARRWQATEQ